MLTLLVSAGCSSPGKGGLVLPLKSGVSLDCESKSVDLSDRVALHKTVRLVRAMALVGWWCSLGFWWWCRHARTFRPCVHMLVVR